MIVCSTRKSYRLGRWTVLLYSVVLCIVWLSAVPGNFSGAGGEGVNTVLLYSIVFCILWLSAVPGKAVQVAGSQVDRYRDLHCPTGEIFRYSFHPRVTAVARKRSRSFCQKCRWQVTAKHTYTLRVWLFMKWHGEWLYGVHRTRRDGSSFMWH